MLVELCRVLFWQPPTNPTEICVANDRHEPYARILASEAIEEAEGAQHCFLRHVFSVGAIASHPARHVVSSVEMRQHYRFKSRDLVACIRGDFHSEYLDSQPIEIIPEL